MSTIRIKVHFIYYFDVDNIDRNYILQICKNNRLLP